MKLLSAAAVVNGHRIEGTYTCRGNRLVVRSPYGASECRTGGIPNDALATMTLRDQARLARILKEILLTGESES